MKVVQFGPGGVTVQLTRDEIGFIGNAINETIEALDAWEFSTRTGTTIPEAKDIQQQIKKIYSEMG
jgi:hypothetical protein